MNHLDTLEQQLDRVQAAIASIEEGAQEFTIGSKKMTKANLPVLYQREADLKAAIADRDGNNVSYAQMGML